MWDFNMFKVYLLRKSKYHEWMVMAGYDFKTVKKAEVKEYEKSGWEFVEERIIYISDLKDWFLKQKVSDKIAIVSLIVGSIIGLLALL